MVKVYADDTLVYAPHVDGYGLIDLQVTQGVNKAGTAEIKMPPTHPAYSAFTPYKTLITIYRHDVLLFRGRVLYMADDLYGCRTITCEGERGFFHDVVIPPYLYETDPVSILLYVLVEYNVRVANEAKKFRFGDATVTDLNNYIRLESEEAQTAAEVLDKLVERCGGFMTFSTTDDGEAREINWYAEMERQSGQIIEFGENLLDFTSTGANTELATAIYPYGAKDEETGVRVDITSVNGGEHFIQDADAVERYGFISTAVYWDDVTLPENLLKKAQAYLETSKLLVTTLELSAVDLSVLDKDIDTFAVGDWVRVYSAPHGLDASFMLRERTYNLLHPEQDKVVLGKDLATLTGMDVAGDRSSAAQVQRATQNITRDYTAAVNKITSSKVNVSGSYMTNDGLLLQWGTVTVTLPGSYDAARSAVIFAYPYKEDPVVLLTPLGSVSVQDLDVQVANVSTTGATVEAADYTDGDVVIQWLAIGQSA